MKPVDVASKISGPVSLLVSIGGLLVSVLSLFVSTWSANSVASSSALTLATTTEQFNKRLFADLRPWVSIRPRVKDIYVRYGKLSSVTVEYDLENHGHAAALDIQIESIGGQSTSSSGVEEVINKCKKEIGSKVSFAFASLVILPGQQSTMPGYLKLSSEVDGSNPSRLSIFGCLLYRTPVDDLWHQTGFAYDVTVKDSYAYSKMDFTGDIAAKEITVLPAPYSSFVTAN